jgi:hypothetical protein
MRGPWVVTEGAGVDPLIVLFAPLRVTVRSAGKRAQTSAHGSSASRRTGPRASRVAQTSAHSAAS